MALVVPEDGKVLGHDRRLEFLDLVGQDLGNCNKKAHNNRYGEEEVVVVGTMDDCKDDEGWFGEDKD